MSRIAQGSLAALGAGLALVLALEMVPGGATLPDTGAMPAAPAPAKVATAPETGVDNVSVTSILARPLFNRSRRPNRGSEPVAGVLRLTGVIVGPTGREAIFQPLGGGKPLIVFEGERINGALVRLIAPGAVLMIDPRGAHLISPAYGPASTAPAARLGLPGGGSR